MEEEPEPEVKTCRIQNPDIPRAGRVGAHGGAAGQSEDWKLTEQFNQETSVPRTPQSIEYKSPEHLSRRTNKRNPM